MVPNFLGPRPRPLGRRAFLKGAGVSVALPLLDAMIPAFARTAPGTNTPGSPRRMVAIETNMGILPQHFFPEQTGRDYVAPPYLEILRDFRKDFTVFSGVSHPEVDGGHAAEAVFLTAAPHPGSGSFRNSISLDQFAAERLPRQTRFPTISLCVGHELNRSLSYTRAGIKIPSEGNALAFYRRMFLQDDARQLQARLIDLYRGRSMLDFVQGSAKRLERKVGPRDRERLDQYFTAVRELEAEMTAASEWERRPRPRAPLPPPAEFTDHSRIIEGSRLMYKMIRLALETDSTRLITLFICNLFTVSDVPGVTNGTHVLSHHGNRPEVLSEIRLIEEAQFRVLAELLGELRGVRERGQPLLDRTMVLYGTCMGSANAHSNANLPVLLAGGGFQHGQHLAFDRQRNHPLPNLFVSMLQRLGVEASQFASSTGTLRGLDTAR